MTTKTSGLHDSRARLSEYNRCSMKISAYFLTQTQAASYLGVNRLTIYRWLKAGKLTGQRVGQLTFIEVSELRKLKARRGNTQHAQVEEKP